MLFDGALANAELGSYLAILHSLDPMHEKDLARAGTELGHPSSDPLKTGAGLEDLILQGSLIGDLETASIDRLRGQDIVMTVIVHIDVDRGTNQKTGRTFDGVLSAIPFQAKISAVKQVFRILAATHAARHLLQHFGPKPRVSRNIRHAPATPQKRDQYIIAIISANPDKFRAHDEEGRLTNVC
jgi:hypothetical protein